MDFYVFSKIPKDVYDYANYISQRETASEQAIHLVKILQHGRVGINRHVGFCQAVDD
jgi:hypothetical protein